MKVIGFIGAYDKTDLLVNLAKIITEMKNRVLLIDSTINQKAKYVVPAINPTISYITSFEDIDIAIGFETMEQIKEYLGTTAEIPYYVLLIDVDTTDRIMKLQLENANKNYFVTSFDLYSLKKGLEIFNGLKDTMNLTKVLYTKEILKEDDDYLNFLSLGYKIIWNDERIYFPIENGDLSVLYENQRVQKVKFRKLSTQYKEGLDFIAQEILEQKNDTQIRKIIKDIEKGV